MRSGSRLPAALVFDFDGLVIDTETSLLEAWRATYASAGVPFPEAAFREAVGGAEAAFDPCSPLREPGLQDDAIAGLSAAASERHHRALKRQPLQPGVAELVAEAVDRGVPLAIASNSSQAWVERHLRSHGLRAAFAVLACRGDGAPKPAPDLYLHACGRLGVPPAAAIALEDSARGVKAATSAGLVCIAVPGPTTAGHDFHLARAIVPTLAGIDLTQLASLAGFAPSD